MEQTISPAWILQAPFFCFPVEDDANIFDWKFTWYGFSFKHFSIDDSGSIKTQISLLKTKASNNIWLSIFDDAEDACISWYLNRLRSLKSFLKIILVTF